MDPDEKNSTTHDQSRKISPVISIEPKSSVGNLWKYIKVHLNDGAHANFLARIRADRLNQKMLFKEFIQAYLDDNEDIRNFVKYVQQKNHKKISKVAVKKEEKERKKNIKDFGLDDSDIQSLFDELEKEESDNE